jgi:hypothetical protein
MAIDAAHRSSIYQKLLPLLGDDDANVLMSEFPSVEAQELVTKDFLRAELAITRGDLRAEMEDLRIELRTEMGELRTELRTEMGELRTEIAEVRTDMARLESRLTLRLGSAIAASTVLLGGIGVLA